MVRGLYSSAAGALVAQAAIDNIANNLANVTTKGFKQSLMQVQAQPSLDLYRYQTDPGRVGDKRLDGTPAQDYVGQLGTGAQIYDTPVNFSQGAIDFTGNPFDFAVSGPGFFAVRGANGIRYTRDGSFVRAANGSLQTLNGEAVLDANGNAISLARDGKYEVDPQGNINLAGQPVARIAVVEFTNLGNLRPEGSNRFVDDGNAAPQPARASNVLQYSEEKSNANVVSQMVALITNQRWFEANEKSIQTQDDATNQAITTVGRTQ